MLGIAEEAAEVETDAEGNRFRTAAELLADQEAARAARSGGTAAGGAAAAAAQVRGQGKAGLGV